MLARELPQFKRTKNGAGYHIYKWNVGFNLCFYVGLHTHSRDDSFTVEIAWNDRDEFPGMAFGMSPKEMPKKGGFRGPLSGFWTDDDPGWELAPGWSDEEWEELELDGKIPEETPIEEAMKKVKPQVANAIARLREHGLPYFAKIAKKFGHKLVIK